ncbi:MAG TPA: DUF1326 domain-containing protein [Planctomycetota bacterium]|nr:DUF1326 domain-containing protein [Planctomycetota bacterium]
MTPLSLAMLAMMTLTQDKAEYSFKGEAFEGCECSAVCPCVWTKDTTFGDCRGTVAFVVSEGTYGKTDLKGVTWAVSLVHTDVNMLKAFGKWEGVLYLSDKSTPEQQKAVGEFAKARWGAAFSKIEAKVVPMEVKLESDHKELTIAKVTTLKVTGMKTPAGKVPSIENPPFSLYPKLYCAKSDVNVYEDGTKWDFTGHNAFYGPFDYTSKKE